MKYEALVRAAQDALDVQNACNLTGVLRTFASHTEALWADARSRGEGTGYVARHPVVILFLDKLCDLAGYRADLDQYAGAEYWCKQCVAMGPIVKDEEIKEPAHV